MLSSHELVDQVCDEARFGKYIKGGLELAGKGLFAAYTDEHISLDRLGSGSIYIHTYIFVSIPTFHIGL